MVAGVPAFAQQRFPSRPVVIVVPFAAGGVADLVARAVAEHMTASLGSAVVVENKPSAGSIVASQAVATAKPDGHTLLLMSNGNAVSVGLFKKLPYDTEKDFAPITTLGSFDIGVFVPANSRFKTLQEMLAYAKANPGQAQRRHDRAGQHPAPVGQAVRDRRRHRRADRAVQGLAAGTDRVARGRRRRGVRDRRADGAAGG